MAADNAAAAEAPVEQVEPPDEDGFHFAETDPSQRFGRFDQVLGRGAFKVVYKAFDTQEGTEVAWNQVRVSELMSAKDAENKEERDRLFAEIRVLKALKHKNIMSFYDSWYDPRTYTVNFITELFTSGTLRQYRKRHKHIDEEVLKRWAWQILCGLVYLHGHNPPIIHRDLKCDNIFINGSDGVVKIGDLGLATMLRSRTAPQSVLGTPEFMAPELYEEEYDDRVDVYSFGMCLLELSTMEYPYSECKNAAQIYRKVSLGVRPAGLQKVASTELGEFINVCISPRDSRPRARQLLKHAYFDSIRKDKLLTLRGDTALAAHPGGGDGGSEYGSIASGPVSRTASSLSEMVQASNSGGYPGPGSGGTAAAAPSLQGLPSTGSVSGPPQHPLSRTVSGDAHSDKSPSDSASVRSQRSNASELAQAVLENIAEESEAAALGPAAGSPAVRSRQASKQGSPRGSPPRGEASPTKPGSPTGSDGCRCDATERRFMVKGDWLEENARLQLRLRICEPNGTSRTVEFEFDVHVDTAADVAGEMVADLELTPEDAAVIATAIKDELGRLSAQPEIDEVVSMSLTQAAQAMQHSLTTNALEQANSGGCKDLLTNGGGSSRQLGRFCEQTSAPSSPAQQPVAAALQAAAPHLAEPPPATPPSGPPAEGQQARRPSLEGQQPQSLQQVVPPLRRSGGSSSSLVSVSSASSLPHSVASQPASEPAQQQPGACLTLPPSLARTSPPPRPPSTQPSGAEPRHPVRPMSPLTASVGSAYAATIDFPSPFQHVLRSNSVDAMPLLSRTSSLPPGRELAASPLGIDSGALSPTSGILSPAATVQEKRTTLMEVFENLADYEKRQEQEQRQRSARIDSPGLEAAIAAVAAASLPPLPHVACSGRTMPPSNSTGAVEATAGCGGSGDLLSAMLRPRSEACLASLSVQNMGRMSPGLLVPNGAAGSAPTAGGSLAAAVALSEHATSLAYPASASSNVSPRSAGSQAASSAAAAMEVIQRLDLQTTAAVPFVVLAPLPPAPVLARVGAHALSAPPSKVPSRDGSPSREREGSLSPTRVPADAGHLNGRRPPIRDKEALRRQAADAMKAVELRSLNLLEGRLGASKAGATRGVPMAATRSMSSLCSLGAPPLAAAPGSGIAAVQAPSQQQPQTAANGISGAVCAAPAAAAAVRPPAPHIASQAAPQQVPLPSAS